MRKISRQRSEEWAIEVFRRAPFVTVSMVRPSGLPYGVAVNMAVKDNRTFFFHCAYEGEKMECLSHNPNVSLLAVSKCSPAYEAEKNNFTEHYRSAIALGRATMVEDPGQKTEALKLICERFLPKAMDRFDEAVERSMSRTAVVRIDLTEPAVGKEKA